MNFEEARKVLKQYSKMLDESLGPHQDQQVDRPPKSPQKLALTHALYMCMSALEFHSDKVHKTMRWLGFVQGVFWVTGFRSIEDMKKDNMPKE